MARRTTPRTSRLRGECPLLGAALVVALAGIRHFPYMGDFILHGSPSMSKKGAKGLLITKSSSTLPGMKTTSAWIGYALAGLLLAACGVPKEKHAATLAELKKCQDDAARLQAESDLQKSDMQRQIDALTGERDTEKTGRSAAEKSLADLQTNLKA